MDWPKAKTVLIIVVLLLNIFFAINIGIYTFGTTISAQTISNTLVILENRGISLDEELTIPRYNKKTPMLMFEIPQYDTESVLEYFLGDGDYDEIRLVNVTRYKRGKIQVNFKADGVIEFSSDPQNDGIILSGLDLKDIKQVEKSLRNFMKNSGLPFSDYILDWYVYTGGDSLEIAFVQKYRNFYVYDNSVYFVLQNGKIKYMRYSYKEIKGFTGQPTEILPAHVILLSNMTEDTEGKIISIDLGFKGYEQYDIGTVVKTKSQSPVWRVKMRDEDGRIICRHFSAYDGEEMESRK